MKRKLGLLALAVIFLLTSTVTGTLAYQVNAAERSTEIQVSGAGVDIKNHLTRRGSDLGTLYYFTMGEDNLTFVEREPLYVAVYDENFDWKPTVALNGTDCMLWDTSEIRNTLERITFVENTGAQPVYVRTVFAIEADKTGFNGTLIHLNRNTKDYLWEYIPDVMIDGVKYDLYVATYKEVLTSGTHTPPSLLQIAMDRAAGNDQVMQYAPAFEVKIVSQAVATLDESSAAFTDLDGDQVIADDALNGVFGVHPWSTSQ